jgi:DNA-binding CsgD family transcriptional regulator
MTWLRVKDPSQVIDDIYEAATEPTRWAGALIRVVDFVGGQAAAILWRNSSTRSLQVLHHFGIKRYYANQYSSAYWKCDPTATMASHGDSDRIVSIPELVPYDEFRRGRFYREWGQPQGWIDSANAMLARTSTGHLQFSIIRHRSQGMVSDDMRLRMSFVLPHLKRLQRIGRTIDDKLSRVATFAQTLNTLGAALILVDQHGGIVHANASGAALLSDNSLLSASDGKLGSSDANIEQAVREALQSALSGETATSRKSIALPLVERDGEHYVVRIRALPLGSRRPGGTAHSAIAIVLVYKTSVEAPLSGVIAKTWKLTPTEMRVLRAIVEVGGVPEVAIALGVAESTVKTHLLRIFGKTGAQHQADLVKLVLSLSIPVLARSA